MGPIEGLGKDGKAIHYLGDEVVCCCCCTQSSLGSVGYLEAGNPSQDPLFQGLGFSIWRPGIPAKTPCFKV